MLHVRTHRVCVGSARLATLALVLSLFASVARAGDNGATRTVPPPKTAAKVPGARETYAIAPEAGSEAAPLVVYLHGIQGRPENGCPWFSVPEVGPVVCPAATRETGAGTYSWTSSAADDAVVEGAVTLARARGANAEPPLLVGFSQGAYLAARLAPAHPGRFRALVLIGADATLDAKALLQAGITRVALLAGDYDAASRPMRRTQAALAVAGFDARFTSLGRVGHTYVPEDAAHLGALRESLAWAAAPQPRRVPAAEPSITGSTITKRAPPS